MVTGAEASVVRMSRLVRANVIALIDLADDPAAMLQQLLRDFTENIADADQAVAQTVSSLRLMEDDLREARADEMEWAERASTALHKARSLRAHGELSEADRCDELVRVALRRQARFERAAAILQQQVSQQTQLSERLRAGLDRLRMKRDVLLRNADELAGRSRPACVTHEPRARR